MSNFISRITSIFKSEDSSQHLKTQLETLLAEHRQMKQELNEIKSRLHMHRDRSKHGGFSHKGGRQRFSDTSETGGGTITDLHGNLIQVQGRQSSKWGTSPAREIMETKGTRTPTLNVRRCRVWGCIGMNEIDGYCQKHYQKLKKVSSSD